VSVTQVHEALGQFSIELLGNVPREVLDNIDHFDHIAVIPGRMDPRQYGDNTLTAARYVGVVRRKKIADDGRTNLIEDDIQISGVGMEFWLGDDDGKGQVIENLTTFTTAGFSTVINALRPSSVSNGTLYTVTGSYTGRHQYETPRSAIQYVCETMSSTTIPVGYRVNNNATLDAGPESSLFVTSPTCVIMRKGSTQGEDMTMRALPSTVDMDIDMEDFSTRVVMLAEANGENLATGTADIATVAPGVNIYKDIFGQPLALTKLVSESDTLEANADTRAALALKDVIAPHRTLTISTDDFDVYGSFNVGDYIWAYDPDAGLFDVTNEVYIRGIRINPIRLRVTEMDFPVTQDYTVAHRDKNGVWTNISDYVHFEEDQPSQVVIGDFNRDLTDAGSVTDGRTGAVTPPNNDIPAAPVWVTASFQVTNYEDGQGTPKARQKLVWSAPLNTDGTAITDGDHYEIRYRLNAGSQYSQTWAAASTLPWSSMSTWDQPVNPDDTPWQPLVAPWGDSSLVIHELPVGTAFESQIRAVDSGGNQGAWSLLTIWTTSQDNIPPSTPAPPTVAGNPVSIQVSHTLGKSSGGTYNLENDLAYFEVHYSSDNNFFPTTATQIGHLRANKGMMAANVPAIGTFTIPETNNVFVKVVAVDTGGNRSGASTAASVTASLIDDQYISNLTASKITAGSLNADVVLGATIKTASVGQRMELSMGGLQAYDVNGDLVSNFSSNPSATGEFLGLRDTTGAIVAQISSTGDGSFPNLFVDNSISVDGTDLQSKFDVLPRGILAITQASSNSASATTAADTAGGAVWNRLVIRDFDPTRQYEIGYRMRADVQANSPSYVGLNCYYAWGRKATNLDNDGSMFLDQFGGRQTASATDTAWSGVHIYQNASPSATDLHLGFYVVASIAGIQYQGTPYGQVWLKDIGQAIAFDTFNPATDGGGVDGGATPVQTITKIYNATWCGRYNGSGNRLSSNSDMYQGQYDSTNGNQKSIIGFDWATIQNDLAGATITRVTLTLKNKFWYFNDGGTAVIGTHNSSSSSAPTTCPSLTSNIVQFSQWAKLATKEVTISNTSFGNALRDGTAKGICIGPGPSTSHTYYGYFAGSNDATGKPKLTISYTK
jgi:hypothetical protein